jgi:hypothetical protein
MIHRNILSSLERMFSCLEFNSVNRPALSFILTQIQELKKNKAIFNKFPEVEYLRPAMPKPVVLFVKLKGYNYFTPIL